jgi:hypothetical protein
MLCIAETSDGGRYRKCLQPRRPNILTCGMQLPACFQMTLVTQAHKSEQARGNVSEPPHKNLVTTRSEVRTFWWILTNTKG